MKEQELNILTPAKFCEEIEKIVYESYDIPITEAIIIYCNRTGLEIEIAAKLITPSFKKKIEAEALSFKQVKKK